MLSPSQALILTPIFTDEKADSELKSIGFHSKGEFSFDGVSVKRSHDPRQTQAEKHVHAVAARDIAWHGVKMIFDEQLNMLDDEVRTY